jgi:hypothetical protein
LWFANIHGQQTVRLTSARSIELPVIAVVSLMVLAGSLVAFAEHDEEHFRPGNRVLSRSERAVAWLLTVTRTYQLQQANALAYSTAAICSHRRRQAVASLLPKRLTH